MKKLIAFSLFLSLSSTILWAQGGSPTDFRRSSLSYILIENASLGKSRDMVVKAYGDNPFPEQFNKHILKDDKFVEEQIVLTAQDYYNEGWYRDTLVTPMQLIKALKKYPANPRRYITPDSSKSVVEPTADQLMIMKINKFINEKNLAKQVVASWFNRDENGKMNWDLIKERGRYSASAEKLDQAKSVADPTTFLQDFELIGNTYTVFNRMEFYPNEPYAAAIRDAAKTKALKEIKIEKLLTRALALADTIYEKTKIGYTVGCWSYLYQLDWNENISAKCKQYLFNDNFDSKVAFDTTTIFKLKYVGKTTSQSIVTFKLGEKRSEAEVIDLQIKRTLDNALAKLQKNYVQFRAVSPISSVGPLTARIGVKEGLENKQTFEILEMSYSKLGLPIWKSIGKCTVDAKASPIWDNSQGAEPVVDADGKPLQVKEFTTFAGGGKKIQPGLHFIRFKK
jgi:hypothetical protein